MKGLLGIIFFTIAILTIRAAETPQKEAILSDVPKLAEYKAFIAEKKDAFICIGLAKTGRVDDKVMVELFKLKYDEIEKDANATAAVDKKTGVGADGQAKTVEDGSKNTATQEPGKDVNTHEEKKVGRVLESEDDKVNDPLKTETPANPALPTTSQGAKPQIDHSMYFECTVPKVNKENEKKIFKGVCTNEKVSLSYKPADKAEFKESSIPFNDNEQLYIFATDAMEFKQSNSFTFKDNECKLIVSSVNIIAIAVSSLILIVNLF